MTKCLRHKLKNVFMFEVSSLPYSQSDSCFLSSTVLSLLIEKAQKGNRKLDYIGLCLKVQAPFDQMTTICNSCITCYMVRAGQWRVKDKDELLLLCINNHLNRTYLHLSNQTEAIQKLHWDIAVYYTDSCMLCDHITKCKAHFRYKHHFNHRLFATLLCFYKWPWLIWTLPGWFCGVCAVLGGVSWWWRSRGSDCFQLRTLCSPLPEPPTWAESPPISGRQEAHSNCGNLNRLWRLWSNKPQDVMQILHRQIEK